MANKWFNRIKDTATFTGNSANIVVSGVAQSGYNTFSARYSVADLFDYMALGGTQWESGLGQYVSLNTIARLIAYDSSDGLNTFCNFNAGTKTVYVPLNSVGGALNTTAAPQITRLQIPSTIIPPAITQFSTIDGAPWIKSSDPTQPTYTADARGQGWIIDRTSGYARMGWFANGTASLATADWNVAAVSGTDNSNAMLEMNAFGIKVCAAGKRFVLDATPNGSTGVWAFNYANCTRALSNLTAFTLEAGGSSWINIQGSGLATADYNPWLVAIASNANMSAGPSGFLNAYFPLSGSANPGATTIGLAGGSTSSFAVGDWIAIASLSIQYSGYPHNWDRCEFVQITGLSAPSTINFTPPLRYQHRTDFPDDGNLAQFPGAAKVVQLNSPPGALYYYPGATGTLTWGVDHLYRNMTLLTAVNSTQTYTQLSGRKIRLENCVWQGSSESMCGEFSSYNTTFTNFPEPDKNVGSVHHLKSTWLAGYNFQSASFGSVVLDDCTALGGTGVIVAGHRVEIRGGSYGNITPATNAYGLTRSLVVTDAEALNYTEPQIFPGTTIAVDGVNITFANGTLKCAKNSSLNNLLRVIPGAQLAWEPVSGSVGGIQMFGGDLALLTVLSVTMDATFVYWTTNGSTTSIPSWSSGNLLAPSIQAVETIGSTGCDAIRRASEACRRGLPNRFFKSTFFGPAVNTGTWQNSMPGQLRRVNVNVRQATTVVGSPYFEFEFPLFQANAPTTQIGGAGKNFRVHIDVSQVGLREITTTGTIGFLGADAITFLGTGSPTSIPLNALVGVLVSYFNNYGNSAPTYQLPIVDIEVTTDLGMLGPLTSQFSISNTAVAPVVGNLP